MVEHFTKWMVLTKLGLLVLLCSIFLLNTFETVMDQGLESTNLGYSSKNIPLPGKKDYIKCLINKTETFLRNIRWKTFFFLNPDIEAEDKETYGFKSTKSPPHIPELKDFEDGMLHLVQSVDFKHVNKPFQKQLSKDITNIKSGNKLYVAADKTTNYYKVEPTTYNKLMEQNITKDYKKAPPSSIKRNTIEDKKIAFKLDISDRIDTTANKEAFITLKDHKPNFNNNPACRLINPCKSELAK